MKKQALKLLPLMGVLILSSCSSYSLQKYVAGTMEVDGKFISPFDTSVSVTTYSDEANKYVNENFSSRMWALHKDLDRYHAYDGVNNLYTINNSLGSGEEVVVDDDLYNIIKDGISLTKLTKGIFNICLGKVIDLWTPKFSNGTMSDASVFNQTDLTTAEVADYLQCVPKYDEIENYVILNEENHSVKLNKTILNNKAIGEYAISLGAIAKGYALDQLDDGFIEKNYPAIISLGSSSMEFVSSYPGKEASAWKLTYSNPSIEDFKDSRLFSLEFEGGMHVSTSSDSEKHYCIKTDDGDYLMRCHILNGLTGFSNNYYRSVSVISTDCPNYVLDALSTTLFNIGVQSEFLAMVKTFEEAYGADIEFFYCKPYTTSEINKYDISMSQGMHNMLKESSVIDSVIKLTTIEK